MPRQFLFETNYGTLYFLEKEDSRGLLIVDPETEQVVLKLGSTTGWVQTDNLFVANIDYTNLEQRMVNACDLLIPSNVSSFRKAEKLPLMLNYLVQKNVKHRLPA